MKSFAALVFAIMVSGSVVGASTILPQAASEDPIWTDRPVRVERGEQQYERVPSFHDPYFLKFRVGTRVQVHDASSFVYDSQIYLLSKIIGTDPKRRCRNDAGMVFACGGQSRAFLRKLITGSYLECRVWQVARSIRLADCLIGQRGLAEMMVASGFARAAPGSGLKEIAAQAMRKRVGLWADPKCRAAGGC